MKETKVTFWQLLQEFSIEIPTIQRDYTYGRDGAKGIGEKLVKSILQALIEQNPLSLDFIYGKLEGKENFEMLEKNKQSIESLLSSIKNYASGLHLQVDYKADKQSTSSAEIITFIPLDGQQRLTTLFLIHWYLAVKAGQKDFLNRFSNFTYSTRQSSKEFLEFLCSSEFISTLTAQASITTSVENHELFFSFWKKDPTVRSMIFILQRIEEICLLKDIDIQVVWERLTKETLIYFDFFDLDDFELTDELYVKMNARGKSLSDFEKFKAWLIKSFKSNILIPEWEKKLDISWNDLFWIRRENKTDIDTAYLQFFMNMFLSDYLLESYSSNTSASIINNDLNLKILRKEEDKLGLSKFPIDVFKESTVLGGKIHQYFILLEILSKRDINIELNPNFVKSSLSDFLLEDKNLNWWDHTYQYALRRFIVESKDNLDRLQEWARVIGNLIYNSSIETASLHRVACEGINKILDEIGDCGILESLNQLSESGYGLVEKQLKEEKDKAKIILKNPERNWRELFFDLEKHQYFYGQIGFIIAMPEEQTFDNFKKVADKVSALFSEEIMKDDSVILFRACLSIQTFIPESNHKFTFPNNVRGTVRNRNENWRRFIQKNSNIIKGIIEHPLFDEINIASSLGEVIQNTNYRSELIELLAVDPQNLRYAKQNQIRFFPHTCILLNSSKISGYAVELFTYHWYNNRDAFLGNFQAVDSFGYHSGRGENDIPGLLVTVKGKIYKVICERNSGGYSIFYKDGDLFKEYSKSIFNSVDESIEHIIQQYAKPN